MSHYKSNLRDIEFNLFEVFDRDDVLGTGPFDEVDAETARTILAEVDRLAREDLAASFEDSDRNPPVFDPETARPDARVVQEELPGVDGRRVLAPADPGRARRPARPARPHLGDRRVRARRQRPDLDVRRRPGFAGVVYRNGNERDKKIAQLMVDRQWGATMVLTEPDAGSDVGAGRTKATQNDDGTWNIEGVKRFITSAEHDMTENIIHLVLARPVGVEGVGGPGTKGLSLSSCPSSTSTPRPAS